MADTPVSEAGASKWRASSSLARGTKLEIRLEVGRLALTQVTVVRVHVPQPNT